MKIKSITPAIIDSEQLTLVVNFDEIVTYTQDNNVIDFLIKNVLVDKSLSIIDINKVKDKHFYIKTNVYENEFYLVDIKIQQCIMCNKIVDNFDIMYTVIDNESAKESIVCYDCQDNLFRCEKCNYFTNEIEEVDEIFCKDVSCNGSGHNEISWKESIKVCRFCS